MPELKLSQRQQEAIPYEQTEPANRLQKMRHQGNHKGCPYLTSTVL